MGQAPWSKKYSKWYQFKRIAHGFKGNIKAGSWTIYVQMDKHVRVRGTKKRKMLECPNCGYRNFHYNFWNRTEDE